MLTRWIHLRVKTSTTTTTTKVAYAQHSPSTKKKVREKGTGKEEGRERDALRGARHVSGGYRASKPRVYFSWWGILLRGKNETLGQEGLFTAHMRLQCKVDIMCYKKSIIRN